MDVVSTLLLLYAKYMGNTRLKLNLDGYIMGLMFK